MAEGLKAIAYKLYVQGQSQVDISELLNVHRSTISRWAKVAGWEDRKVEHEMRELDVYETTYELLQYQLKAIKQKKDAWIDKGKTSTLIERGDIDALQKLYSTIKRDVVRWEDYIRISKELLAYLMDADLKLAKELAPHIEDFINLKKSA